VHGVFNQAQSIALLVFGGLPWFWARTGDPPIPRSRMAGQRPWVHLAWRDLA
jgi:hypothetical protein